MLSELKKHILSKLDARPTPKPTDPLTVGVEHEFFLLTSNGAPVDHRAGQAFLAELSRYHAWYIREQSDTTLGPTIMRVSKDYSSDRYCAVKYDHHPHLFEIAFPYEHSLFALSEMISETFALLAEVASRVGLVISCESVLGLPDQSQISSPLMAHYLHYRSLLFEARSEIPLADDVNYAARIAASQIHVGGLSWWTERDLVASLYSLEPSLLALSHQALKRPGADLQSRWQGYINVFRGYPLVGFPHLDSWTLDQWCQALLDSPLLGGEIDEWAGKSANQLGHNPLGNWDAFMTAVRDVQIIRPKLFGTLEFRADPAQPSPEALVYMAAVRLGLCEAAKRGQLPLGNFSAAKRDWWLSVTTGKFPTSRNKVLQLAEYGLRARNLGEEIFLHSNRQIMEVS